MTNSIDFLQEVMDSFYVICEKTQHLRVFEGEITNNKLKFKIPQEPFIGLLEKELTYPDFRRSQTHRITPTTQNDVWNNNITIERINNQEDTSRFSLYRARPYIINTFMFPVIDLDDVSTYIKQNTTIPLSYCSNSSSLPPNYREYIQKTIDEKLDDTPEKIFERRGINYSLD